MQARRSALAVLGIHCFLLVAIPAASLADSLDALTAAPSEAEALRAEMQPLLESLQRATQERDAAVAQVEEATGERLQIYDEQLWERQLDVGRALKALSANLSRQREMGLDVSALLDSLGQRLRATWPRYRQQLQSREAGLDSVWALRDVARGNERLSLEREMTGRAANLQVAYEVLVDATLDLEPSGIDVSELRDYTSQRLSEWAESIAPIIRVVTRQRDELAEQVASEPGNSELKLDLQAEEERLERTTRSLAATVDMLQKLGLETASYQQLLISATGEITTDILDRDVVVGLLGQFRNNVMDSIRSEGPRWILKIVVFVLILLVFRFFGTLVRRVVRRSVGASKLHLSQLLQDTLVSWSSRVVMLIGLLVAFSQVGLEIGPLLAGLGIAGFVLGFALQDSLSNFAAGAMILVYRPFDVGDVIEAAGKSGKVSRMSLVSTTILTFDNQTLIVPNAKIWGDVIRNVTAQQTRRVDLVFGISYADDVEKAEAVLRDVVSKHDKVLPEPQPIIKLHELGDSSVNFVVRPWCRTQDYWDVYWDTTRQVKLRFDAEGISIPFPQRDVHVDWSGPAPTTENA